MNRFCLILILYFLTVAFVPHTLLYSHPKAEYSFNRGYFIYSICRDIVFENEYNINLLVTHDDFVKGAIARLKARIKRDHRSNEYFQLFSENERSSRFAHNSYSNYQKTMSLDGSDLINSFLFFENEMYKNPPYYIIRRILNDKKIITVLDEIEKHIGDVIARYNEIVTVIMRDLRLDKNYCNTFRKVVINYSVASFGETGGLYSSKRRVITIPDITNFTIFINEFFHVFSFDLIRYDKKFYDALSAKKFWLNFREPMDIVLFPFTPFELIDNFLAFKLSVKLNKVIITTSPYLQLFYSSYTPYLSKMFLSDLYVQFDSAFSESSGYDEFVKKALMLFADYHQNVVGKIVYRDRSAISDFFNDIKKGIYIVDGNINYSDRKGEKDSIDRFTRAFFKKYRRDVHPKELYQKFDFSDIQDMKNTIDDYRTLLFLTPDNFKQFVEATFVYIPSLERINPRAKNLLNLCRAYHYLKKGPEIECFIVYYFGVLIVIGEDPRCLSEVLKLDAHSKGIYVRRG
jgi:hypothetical protein